MSVAEKYVDAFGKMAKEGTTLIVPATASDAGSMVAQVISLTISILSLFIQVRN
jgi:C-terminal region of band_7